MKDEGLGLAGWLLADLVLVLAIIFLAIVPGDPEAEPNVAPSWTQIDLGEMRRGSVFNGGVVADGHPNPTFEVVGGETPPGIVLDSIHGLLHGVPEREGDYAFTIRAANGVGAEDRSFEVRVRPPDSACRPEASFEFDQIVVENAQGATWEQLLQGRVRRGLTKADELGAIAPSELGEDAFSFLIERQREGYQIALIETFGGAPNTVLAGAVNDELALALAVEFDRIAPAATAGSAPRAPILLQPDLPRRQWSADYLANNIPPGSARINLYFVKALPPECF